MDTGQTEPPVLLSLLDAFSLNPSFLIVDGVHRFLLAPKVDKVHDISGKMLSDFLKTFQAIMKCNETSSWPERGYGVFHLSQKDWFYFWSEGILFVFPVFVILFVLQGFLTNSEVFSEQLFFSWGCSTHKWSLLLSRWLLKGINAWHTF